MRLSMSAGAGLTLAVDLLAFGETGRKAAFYCRFLFVPSLFPLFFSLSLPVSAHGLQCRASGSLALARSLRLWWCWLSAGGLVSAAAAVLALVLLACPLLGLISGRLCRWCCLRVSLRLSPLLRLALRPLRCCLRVSRRSRVQCCGALPVLGWETM